MFIKSGASIRGESHKHKGVDCQDANYLTEKDGIAIAAVADGLGSSSHSDMAAQEATKFTVEYCAEKITKNLSEDGILSVIKQSFKDAQFHIERKARTLDYELDEVDTTLCLAVFFDGELYYGQAGDSGIIALREDGIFERVTQIDIDDDGYVEPLCREDKWIFEKYPHRVKSMLLVTDGIWKMLVPNLLKDEKHPLNHLYLDFYLNNKKLENATQKQLDESLKEQITSIPPQNVYHDDKTMIILIDTEISVNRQDEEYYKWPDEEKWNDLLKTYEAKLYPHRFQDNQAEDISKSDLDAEKAEEKEKASDRSDQDMEQTEEKTNADNSNGNNEQNTEEGKENVGIVKHNVENDSDDKVNWISRQINKIKSSF